MIRSRLFAVMCRCSPNTPSYSRQVEFSCLHYGFNVPMTTDQWWQRCCHLISSHMYHNGGLWLAAGPHACILVLRLRKARTAQSQKSLNLWRSTCEDWLSSHWEDGWGGREGEGTAIRGASTCSIWKQICRKGRQRGLNATMPPEEEFIFFSFMPWAWGCKWCLQH